MAQVPVRLHNSTALEASIVVPEAIRAVTEILPEFEEITDLRRTAGAVIARIVGEARYLGHPGATFPSRHGSGP